MKPLSVMIRYRHMQTCGEFVSRTRESFPAFTVIAAFPKSCSKWPVILADNARVPARYPFLNKTRS